MRRAGHLPHLQLVLRRPFAVEEGDPKKTPASVEARATRRAGESLRSQENEGRAGGCVARAGHTREDGFTKRHVIALCALRPYWTAPVFDLKGKR